MTDLLMGWDKKSKRWYKRYRGKLYAVSPRKLGTKTTKEDSATAANQWWENKQDEIDKALASKRQHPDNLLWAYNHAIGQWKIFAKWQRLNGDIMEAVRADKMIEFLTAELEREDPPFPLPKRLDDPLWETVRDLSPDEEAEARLLWFDRFRTVQVLEQDQAQTPVEKTTHSHIDSYLNLRKAQAAANGRNATYETDKQWLDCFKNWVPPTSSVENLTEDLWERFYLYLMDKVKADEYSLATAKHYLSAARAFIRSRYNARIIDLPRNLTALSITVPLVQPITFTIPEVKTLLATASDRQKLYVLLALNCGMYPSDIGLLEQKEVDWKKGRIIRQRTKTRTKGDPPIVDFLLWKPTFTLLKKFHSNHSTYAVLSEVGKPLYNIEHRQNNSIKTAYTRLVKRAKIEKSWKGLRKTGATMLENGPTGVSEHTLESPKTVASRHYSHQNGKEFDTALAWLGKQLGVAR